MADSPPGTSHCSTQLILFDRVVVGAGHLPVFAAHLPDVALLELDYTGTVTGTAVVPER